MATTGTETVRDLCTQALRKSGNLAFGEDAPAEDMAAAVDELNVMLKGWQNKEWMLWAVTGGSLTLTTAASYTLDPVRPLQINSARLRRNGIDMPMERMTRQAYDSLPNKASQGTPTQFYYDRQREAALLYVWPVLAAANGETIEFTYERELEDISSANDTLDLPGEWWEAAIYNLAARLMETTPTGGQSPIVPQRAEILLREALAFDREGSVYFAGPYAE